MALAGSALLTGFSEFINDGWASTTTSAGASDGSTVVDTGLRRFGTDTLKGFYVRLTGVTNPLAIRRITANNTTSGAVTVAPPFAAQAATAETYEIHRYDPAKKFKVMDEARMQVFPDLCKVVYDESITTDGRNREYSLPSAVRRGPLYAFLETPVASQTSWNLLDNPDFSTLTIWTTANGTSTLVSRSNEDLLVPKYGNECRKLEVATATNGRLFQDMGATLAAASAGRRMTFAAWVYCRTSGRITAQITDDAGTGTGSTHGGGGWELITVSRNISATNATTLIAEIDISSASGAITCFINRAWLLYGDKLPSFYDEQHPLRVRRDDTTQQVIFDSIPPGRRQVRLVGRDALSALGTTAATQVTNTMEVDDESAPLLYAHAATILFDEEGITADSDAEVDRRIQRVMRRGAKLEKRWGVSIGGRGRLRTPWS